MQRILVEAKLAKVSVQQVTILPEGIICVIVDDMVFAAEEIDCIQKEIYKFYKYSLKVLNYWSKQEAFYQYWWNQMAPDGNDINDLKVLQSVTNTFKDLKEISATTKAQVPSHSELQVSKRKERIAMESFILNKVIDMKKIQRITGEKIEKVYGQKSVARMLKLDYPEF